MTRLLLLTVTLALALLAKAAAPALAASCGKAVYVGNRLVDTFGEGIIEAQDRGGVRLHLWVNRASGTWTLTALHGDTLCVVAAGKYLSGRTIADMMDGPGA